MVYEVTYLCSYILILITFPILYNSSFLSLITNIVLYFSFIESWKENPDFYQYLSKLGGYDVDQLSKSLLIFRQPFLETVFGIFVFFR